MQIKTAIRYATPLLKWTKFKRLIILNFDENMELSYSNSREVKCCSYFRNQWQWYGLIWNISNRLMFWMLDHPSWWCYFGRLWKLWRWGIAGGSRSLCFLFLVSCCLPLMSWCKLLCSPHSPCHDGLTSLKLWTKRNLSSFKLFMSDFLSKKSANQLIVNSF
jgi:hypothetical protein